MSDLLTTTEAAQFMGVSVSSVKRWADQGVLPCVKTQGRHRRFERSELEKFALQLSGEQEAVPRLHGGWSGLWDALMDPESHADLEARLLAERARLGSWWAVAEDLGELLVELGASWARGEISVLQERLATERLSRALDRIGSWIPTPSDAPAALLATAEGDDHTLGLSLVELCLRELGWSAFWAGPRTPVDELVWSVERQALPIRMVALSASAGSSSPLPLARLVQRLRPACARNGVALVLGGAGAWPEPLEYAVRLRDFRSFHEYVVSLGHDAA